MSELNDASEILSVLDDLRRHLLWQVSTGSATLLADRPPSAASAGTFRDSFRARHEPSPPAPRAEAPRAAPAPAPTPAPATARPIPSRPVPAETPAFLRPPAARPVEPAPLVQRLALGEAAPPVGRTLEDIRSELGDCQRCKLCKTRKNIVFGSGNPRAELVFVGEGPGENEDLQGLPFVGAAGELLTKMIDAMGFSRDTVYICNVVKCRPPGNRNPEPDEIAACEPFLKAQLASIQPKVIVTLGKWAAQTLLRDQTAITRMRGNWREYCGIQLMPTFHPAYLLRNPAEKKVVWQDLQQVMKVLGTEQPKKQ